MCKTFPQTFLLIVLLAVIACGVGWLFLKGESSKVEVAHYVRRINELEAALAGSSEEQRRLDVEVKLIRSGNADLKGKLVTAQACAAELSQLKKEGRQSTVATAAGYQPAAGRTVRYQLHYNIAIPSNSVTS